MSLHSITTLILFVATITFITCLQIEYRQRSNENNVDPKPFQDDAYLQRNPDEMFDPFYFILPFSTIVRRRGKRRNQDKKNQSNSTVPQTYDLIHIVAYQNLLPLSKAVGSQKNYKGTPECS